MRCATARLTDPQIDAIARRINRPVVLVGLMGTGKSTVGRRLAAMIRRDFVDSDEAIEQAAAMTVAEMFERFGEAHFRDGERRVIARLIAERHGVIATGGGAFIHPETRALIRSQAIAVWLDASIDTLVTRTARKSNRPLLRGGDPRSILTRLRDERAPFYGEAPIRILSGETSHDEVAIDILKAIDRWL